MTNLSFGFQPRMVVALPDRRKAKRWCIRSAQPLVKTAAMEQHIDCMEGCRGWTVWHRPRAAHAVETYDDGIS